MTKFDNARIDRPARVMVRVRVYQDDGTVDHDRVGDHKSHEFRSWIGSTAYWALRNGRTITTYPVPPDTPPHYFKAKKVQS